MQITNLEAQFKTRFFSQHKGALGILNTNPKNTFQVFLKSDIGTPKILKC